MPLYKSNSVRLFFTWNPYWNLFKIFFFPVEQELQYNQPWFFWWKHTFSFRYNRRTRAHKKGVIPPTFLRTMKRYVSIYMSVKQELHSALVHLVKRPKVTFTEELKSTWRFFAPIRGIRNYCSSWAASGTFLVPILNINEPGTTIGPGGVSLNIFTPDASWLNLVPRQSLDQELQLTLVPLVILCLLSFQYWGWL